MSKQTFLSFPSPHHFYNTPATLSGITPSDCFAYSRWIQIILTPLYFIFSFRRARPAKFIPDYQYAEKKSKFKQILCTPPALIFALKMGISYTDLISEK